MWFFFFAYCDVKSSSIIYIIYVKRFVVTAKEKWCVKVKKEV